MQEAWDKVYNYSALALAILDPNHTIDSAIDRFSPPQNPRRKDAVLPEVTLEMIEMRRAGKSFQEIGLIYGLNRHTVFSRIKRYKGVI